MDFSQFPKKVKIVEVGPRDGLQNEEMVLDTEVKINFIQGLIKAGLKSIEVTSFVRADRIPQMKDARELYAKITKSNDYRLPCLVPNLKGLDIALQLGVKEIAVFTATSDSFNKKNINATVDESLVRLLPVIEKAKENGLSIRGYVSTAFGCPYEGETSFKRLKCLSHWLLDNGCYEISLGDTIGCAQPKQVNRTLTQLKNDIDIKKIALHFHDTRNMALPNILTGLSHGVSIYDSSAGGLGGCPYAKGATGNVATEDLVYLLNSLNIETGVDLDKLSKASMSIFKHLHKSPQSKVLIALNNSNDKLIGPFD